MCMMCVLFLAYDDEEIDGNDEEDDCIPLTEYSTLRAIAGWWCWLSVHSGGGVVVVGTTAANVTAIAASIGCIGLLCFRCLPTP